MYADYHYDLSKHWSFVFLNYNCMHFAATAARAESAEKASELCGSGLSKEGIEIAALDAVLCARLIRGFFVE